VPYERDGDLSLAAVADGAIRDGDSGDCGVAGWAAPGGAGDRYVCRARPGPGDCRGGRDYCGCVPRYAAILVPQRVGPLALLPQMVLNFLLERSGGFSIIPQEKAPRILEISVEDGIKTVRVSIE
jgi:hypothetical protein